MTATMAAALACGATLTVIGGFAARWLSRPAPAITPEEQR